MKTVRVHSIIHCVLVATPSFDSNECDFLNYQPASYLLFIGRHIYFYPLRFISNCNDKAQTMQPESGNTRVFHKLF